MCGIVGYVGGKQAAPFLREGLRRLEYRGYDSAGLALVADGALKVLRSVGKLANLDEALLGQPLLGTLGLGHTRWATHGPPSERNAHPHTDCTRRLAVVHNGIIENHAELKEALAAKGHAFASETDTEVLAHLIEDRLEGLLSEDSELSIPARFFEAIRRSLLTVRGAYALAVVWSELPELIVTAKTASPLVIGLGEGETFIASDVPAFLQHTRKVLFLEDGEIAVLGPTERLVFSLSGSRVEKEPVTIPWDHQMAQKSGYPHFMLKEIHEQPQALASTIRGRITPLDGELLEREAGLTKSYLRSLTAVHLVGCGTAHHAGMVGKYLFERYARLPAQAEVASEFRYRTPVLTPTTLVVAVSQSGETADTLAAVRLAKESGAKVLAVSNTMGSAIARAADFNLYTRCGPECGVASTKAFLGQLAGLTLLALHASAVLGTMPADEARGWEEQLGRLPDLVSEAVKLEKEVREIAADLGAAEHCLFLGRGYNYPTALEGALKLKEISYIHAEGYAAGEMKHGPIALIEPGTPVIAVATRSPVFDKVVSNIEEARSRGAKVVALCDRGETRLAGKVYATIELPPTPDCLSPLVNSVPLQLLAYHAASLRGCDVDQPRNLAKSVTVE